MKAKTTKILLWGAFLLYLLAAYGLIIGKSWDGAYLAQCYASFDSWKGEILWSLNLIPLRFIFDTQGYTGLTWCKNVIGNVLLFVPLGFFLLCLAPSVRAWSFKRYVAAMAALILGIELFQLFFMCGHCDIDDFLLNLTGACLGYWGTKQMWKLSAKQRR